MVTLISYTYVSRVDFSIAVCIYFTSTQVTQSLPEKNVATGDRSRPYHDAINVKWSWNESLTRGLSTINPGLSQRGCAVVGTLRDQGVLSFSPLSPDVERPGSWNQSWSLAPLGGQLSAQSVRPMGGWKVQRTPGPSDSCCSSVSPASKEKQPKQLMTGPHFMSGGVFHGPSLHFE